MSNNNNGVYWLASYPKSGNTWMRSFIQGMHALKGLTKKLEKHGNTEGDTPMTDNGLIDINAMRTGFIASSRMMIQQILGFDLSDFHNDEIDMLRSDAYSWHARNVNMLQYHKIHDAYVYLPNGHPLIPDDSCLGVLYMVRNPFDVAISYANHSNISLDVSIDCLNNSRYALADPKYSINNQFRQYLYNWSQHVESWLSARNLQVKCVRYEDMKYNPAETFLDVAKFLQISDKASEVSAVLEEIHIEKLQKQEQEKGFMEKTAMSKSFFRKGIVGDWEQTLNQQQIDRIIERHGGLMQRLGYLDDMLKPTELIKLRK